jgi:hypothetical protein
MVFEGNSRWWGWDQMYEPDAGGDGSTVTADYAVLDGIKNRFNDLAAAFRNASTPLGQHYDQAAAGAGQFRDPDFQRGAVKFLLSWREAFGVCQDSAGLIAGNIGKQVVDLKAVDVDQSTAITI